MYSFLLFELKYFSVSKNQSGSLPLSLFLLCILITDADICLQKRQQDQDLQSSFIVKMEKKSPYSLATQKFFVLFLFFYFFFFFLFFFFLKIWKGKKKGERGRQNVNFLYFFLLLSFFFFTYILIVALIPRIVCDLVCKTYIYHVHIYFFFLR